MASRQCPSPTTRSSGSNRLMHSLVVLSLVAHAGIFLHISRVYRSNAVSYIEMTVQTSARPAARNIPRPRPRPRRPPPAEPMKKPDRVQRPLPRLRALAVAPIEGRLPASLMEQIRVPEVPQTPGVDSSEWVAAPQIQETTGEFMTASSYLDMVRLKIERRKRYPETAKSRYIEGRVTIRFVLLTDGGVRDVTVVRAARSKELNTAALDAVQRAAPFPKPPSNLFKRDLPLELTIVFELT